MLKYNTLASAFSSFPFSCCPLHVAPPSSGPNPPFRAENLDLGHFRRVSSFPFLSGPVRACLCGRFACRSLRLAQERLLHSLRTLSKSRFYFSPLWNLPRRGPMTFTEAPRDAGRGRVAEAAATAAGRTLPTYLPTMHNPDLISRPCIVALVCSLPGYLNLIQL